MRQLGFVRFAALLLGLVAACLLGGGSLTPVAAASCQVDSDCYSYCCITYGACGGDSICSPRHICLC